MNSISDKMMERIQQKGQGWVFIPADFFDLGSRTAVYSALRRLLGKGKIRHFSRGLYDFPRYSQLWNEFGVPDQDGIVEAVARQAKCAILPSGATAANLLGFSEQVPAKLEYVWAKKTKKFQIDNFTFVFRHAPQSWVVHCGHSIAGVILQALDWFGVNSIDNSMVKHLAHLLEKLSKKDKYLLKNNAPDWVSPIIKQIAYI